MIHYIIQVLIFQTLFLAIYDLFLKKETFFQWNRAYLIVSSILAYLIPFIKIESATTYVQENFITLPEVILNPEMIFLNEVNLINENTSIFTLQNFYILGITIAFLLFIYKISLIFIKIYQNTILRKKDYNLVILPKQQTAFSFFKYLFLGKSLFEKDHQHIIKHELTHIKQKHSIDLIYFELQKIVFWFNPFSYLFQNRISALHEYIADAKTIKEENKQSFFESLLNQTFQIEKFSFVNQFYKKSLIKKRIIMATKNKSKEILKLKYLLVVPIIILMFGFTSIIAQKDTNILGGNTIDSNGNPTNIYVTEDHNNKLIDSSLQNNNRKQIIDSLQNIEEIRRFILKKRGVSQEDIDRLIEKNKKEGSANILNNNENYDIKEKLKEISELKINYGKDTVIPIENKIYNLGDLDEYPYLKNTSITDNKERGMELLKIFIQLPLDHFEFRKENEKNFIVPFIINSKGKIININYDEVPKKYLANIKEIVEMFPNNIVAGKKNGKPVNTKWLLMFSKKYTPSQTKLFAEISKKPIYQGCENAIDKDKCFQERINKYIAKEFDMNLVNSFGLTKGKHRVTVQFLINTYGNTLDAKVNTNNKKLREHIQRIIYLMPQMQPGLHHGKKVNVRYSLPIAFEIKDNDNNISTSYKPITEVTEREEISDVPFSVIDEVPVFPGCSGNNEELKKCMSDHITKHVSKNFNVQLAKDLGLEAGKKRISIQFKIDTDGYISDIRARAPHPKLEEEAIRIIKLLPKMQPGKQDNKAVNVRYNLPIIFNVEDDKNTENQPKDDIRKNSMLDYQSPVYPGCENEKDKKRCLTSKIYKHISQEFDKTKAQNLGLKPGLQMIRVAFIVNKEGETEVTSIRSPHKKLDEEVKRVISTIPKMKPAMKDHKPINTQYNVPIKFMVKGGNENEVLEGTINNMFGYLKMTKDDLITSKIGALNYATNNTNYTVTSFEININHLQNLKITGNRLNDNAKAFINKLEVGDSVKIYNIKTKNNSSSIVPITIKIK